MKFYYLLFILCIILTISCLNIRFVEGIIGGQAVGNNQNIYTVSVQANNRHICGGAIIEDRYILTAARCIIGEDDQFVNMKYSIVAGVFNLEDNSSRRITIDVEIMYIPNEYKRINPDPFTVNAETGDIAVLKLKNQLILSVSTQLKALELPKKQLGHYLTFYKHTASITGFGVDSNERGVKRDRENNEIPRRNFGQLNVADTIIISRRTCKPMYNFNIHEKYICASLLNDGNFIGKGTCDGDDGGPLVINEKTIVGILSRHTLLCSELDNAAIYTRITSFISFIKNIITGKELFDTRVAAYKITGQDDSSNATFPASTENLVEVTRYL